MAQPAAGLRALPIVRRDGAAALPGLRVEDLRFAGGAVGSADPRRSRRSSASALAVAAAASIKS